jgi:hypothetical protein
MDNEIRRASGFVIFSQRPPRSSGINHILGAELE